AQFIHHAGDPFATEHTHQVIFQRYVELGAAWISLATGTTAQLPVYTTAFMSFRTDNSQSTGFFYARAEFNIGTPACHVGGDGYSACQTGFGHNTCLAC